MKHTAYPSILVVSLILAACGGGGSDVGTSAASNDVSPSAIARADAGSPMAAEASLDAPADTIADIASELEAAASPESEVAQTPSETDIAPVADAAPAPASATTLAGISTFVTGTTASSAALYVATTGSDSNPGTKTAPFKTITKAAAVAKPGTTVFVAPGTYSGGFVTSTSGTASARIRYVSSTKWGAKIVPPASSTNNIAWRNRGNYVDIVAFEVDGARTQSGTKWRTGISAVGSYNLIANNHIHHIAQLDSDCTSNGGSGINSNNYYYGYHNEISGNVVHHIGALNCKYISGVYMSTSGSVHNNLIYQNGNWGIQTWHDAANMTISNNTVVKNGKGILVGGGGYYHLPGPADNIRVSNNIVYGNTSYGIAEMGEVGTNNTYTYNMSYKNGSNWMLKTWNSHSSDINAEPQFMDYAGGDYRLKTSSPAINRATSTYAPPIDIRGIARPLGGASDLGAYETM